MRPGVCRLAAFGGDLAEFAGEFVPAFQIYRAPQDLRVDHLDQASQNRAARDADVPFGERVLALSPGDDCRRDLHRLLQASLEPVYHRRAGAPGVDDQFLGRRGAVGLSDDSLLQDLHLFGYDFVDPFVAEA